MEDLPDKRGRVYRHRKLIAGIVIIFITLQLINIVPNLIRHLNPEPDPLYEPSHSLTVWISPEEEEFHLHLDFYSSEQNAVGRVNRLVGKSIRVEPVDDEQNNGVLYTLPENLLSVWVKIYFDQDDEEPCIILRLELGQKITTTLLGREISILMEVWRGE